MDTVEIQVYSKEIARLARGGLGAGATATATLATTGGIRSVKINNGGSGYALGDVLTVAVGTGGTLTVTKVTTAGKVKGVVVTSPGSGYANATGAATTVAPAGGTGCTVDTVVEFAIDEVTVGAGGSNYTTAIAKFNGGGNANWSYGVATIDTGAVDAVTAPVGVKFASVPTIVIQPGGPVDAAAFNTALQAFDVTQQNARLKNILTVALNRELLTVESAPIVRAALAAL